MSWKPEYGDLVVYDNGAECIIAIWKNRFLSYQDYQEDGSIWISTIHGLNNEYPLNEDCELLEKNFEPPPKTCDKCGSYGYLTE